MFEPELPLTLTITEINVVLQCLGNMPTNTGVWPLLTKIQGQAQAGAAAAQQAAASPAKEKAAPVVDQPTEKKGDDVGGDAS